ncbi:hypothetical protein BH11BAC2_BH11BAC2_23120 [soil metagenome]
MKTQHRFFLLLILTAFVQLGLAQDWNWQNYRYRKPYPGYVINAAGEKKDGYLILNGQLENQKECVFMTDTNDSKTNITYKPADLKEYKVADKTYRVIHYSGGLTSTPVRFVLLTKAGRLSQFEWYDMNDATRVIDAKQVYQKMDEKPFENSAFVFKFAKFWAEQTTDYPELSAKIANKEKGYTLLNMLAFIDEYNAYWAAKK